MIGLWFCFVATFLGGQATFLSIPYTSSILTIDGNAADWDSIPITIPGGGKPPYQNTNQAALAWNEEYLFSLFYIQDHQLCVHEEGDNNPRLYLNDGVEIYLDTRTDSDSVMDKNDYQFLMSLPQASVVFRGDKFLSEQGHKVPKDSENHTVIFQKAITYIGTINDLSDTDMGYMVEAAIPWSTLGLAPLSGLAFKMDLCINDIDTLVDMASMPEDWHPASMNYINLQGQHDFGYPKYWTKARLTGGPGIFATIKKNIDRHWPYFYGGLMFLLLVVAWVIYKQFKKIRFYQSFPTREEVINTLESSNNLPSAAHQKMEENSPGKSPESIISLQTYIERNMEKEIAIEDLSRQVHLSARQIQRLTKEHCGMSPMQWVNVMKMEEAAKRLKESSKTISEIAYALGYEDAAYFSQLFKKYHGASPGNFRKK